MSRNKTYIALLAPYKWKLLLIVLVNIFSVFFSILSLMLIEPFVKILFQDGLNGLSLISQWLIGFVGLFIDISSSKESIVGMVLFVVVLFLLKNIFLYLAQWLIAPVRSNLVKTMRNAIYDKILILPLAFFSEKKKGDVISRAVNDTQDIEFTVIKSIQQFLIEPITLLFYIIALFVISYQLTLFVLILLPVAGFLIGIVSKSLRRKSLKAKTKLGILLSHVEETIEGLRIIKGFNAQDFSENTFERHNKDFTRLQKKIYRRIDLASPLSEFLGITVVMIILVFGGMMVLQSNSSLTAGLFITYIVLFTQIINPSKNISTAVSNYRRGLSALDRIYEILDAEEIITQSVDSKPVSTFNKELTLENVSFSYDHTEVLKNISFKIKKSQIVALVGHSGSGKSTLADLLPRFYDVSSGEIKIDGTNIKDFIIDDLRSLFGLVSQDIVLFNDTIFNNIAFGLKNVSREEVINAARTANAYNFIMELPDNFETNIGDRGLSLSGGERQRISIARAVLRNAPILILDEATSAMDTESEKLVQHALDNVMQNRTSLVIAHRLTTIQHADLIIVIDDGKIVESGTHRELIAQNGLYTKLVEINN